MLTILDSSGVRLSEEDLPTLLDQLKSVAAKWRRIGVCLGFSLGEVENIQTRPTLLSDAPLSWLTAMLEEWMKWVPGDRRGSKNFATLDDLKNALTNAELAKIAYELDVYNPDKAPIFASESALMECLLSMWQSGVENEHYSVCQLLRTCSKFG